MDTGKLIEEFIGPTSAPLALHFSPSGGRLACSAGDRSVRVWDLLPATLNIPGAAPETIKPELAWLDLIARSDAKEVKLNGFGWGLSHGVLESPVRQGATVAAPGVLANTNYHLRLTLRQVRVGGGFAVLGRWVNGAPLSAWMAGWAAA